MVTKQLVVERIAGFLGESIDKFGDDAELADLVTDSFALVEMVIELQEEFGVEFGHEELKDVKTIGDLGRLIEGLGG